MPDKYGTCMLIAFLQQLITYGGFYDGLEWVGLEAVQVKMQKLIFSLL